MPNWPVVDINDIYLNPTELEQVYGSCGNFSKLDILLKLSNPGIVSFLSKILVLNPSKRSIIEEIVQDPIFDDIKSFNNIQDISPQI
jgi:serine/threonine protein kinase